MEATPSQGRNMPSVVTALRYHLPVVLVTAALVIGGAVAFLYAQTASYTASAVVLLAPVPASPLTPEMAGTSGTQLAVAMETEVGIVTSRQVAEEVAERLGRQVPDEGERLSAAVPGGTQMIRVTVGSTSASRAQEGAQAVAEAFLAVRESNAVANNSTQLARLRDQTLTLQEDLQAVTEEAQEAGAGSYASERVQLYAGRLAQLNTTISTAEAINTDPGRVINVAELPKSRDGLAPALVLGAAGIGGVCLGAMVAVFREWRRDLVRDDDEFEVSGVPVFARLPRHSSLRLVIGDLKNPSGHEAYRRIRAGVVANGPRPHVLAVTSVGSHGHASDVTSNLGVCLADAGFTVVVVASNPNSSDVEKIFDIRDSPGLTDVLWGSSELELEHSSMTGLTVLPGGRDRRTGRELYAGPVFRRVIDDLRTDFDYVLVDAAATGTADGDAVIAAADSVLLRVTNSRTRHAEVAAALDRFAVLGVHTIGAVNVTPEGLSANLTPSPDTAGAGDAVRDDADVHA